MRICVGEVNQMWHCENTQTFDIKELFEGFNNTSQLNHGKLCSEA